MGARKNKNGRPTIITDETVQKLEQCLQNGLSVEKSVEICRICKQTFYNNYNLSDSFRTKITLSQQWAAEKARNVIITALENEDLATAKWYLLRSRYTKNDFCRLTRRSSRNSISN